MSDTTRPILFNGPMVRAILEGRKTQTRRVAKVRAPYVIEENDQGDLWPYDSTWSFGDDGSPWAPCPYGERGGLLWVRETFHRCPHCPDGYIAYRASGYRQNGQHVYPDDRPLSPNCRAHGWSPSIHMPRWASRLTLRVDWIAFERLQRINEKNAAAEGMVHNGAGGWFESLEAMLQFGSTGGSRGGPRHNAPSHAFRSLWDGMNAKRGFSWDSNPFVWVVTFGVWDGGPQ